MYVCIHVHVYECLQCVHEVGNDGEVVVMDWLTVMGAH